MFDTSELTKKSRFEQIRDYILKEAKKNYGYGKSVPFSARTFAGWIDEAKQEYLEKCKPDAPCKCDECKWFKKWFGE